MFNFLRSLLKFIKIRQKFSINFSIAGILLIGMFLICNCENPITGYGPQPAFIDKQEHEPMLNIFGILRPGSKNDKPRSFVHLEGTFSVTSEFPDSFDVIDAKVTLYSYNENLIVDSTNFIYTNFNSIFADYEYRSEKFYPLAQKTYAIICKKEGYPTLTSKTTMPNIPYIIENSLIINNNQISFIIERDSLAALYDVYLQVGQFEYYKRILRPEMGNIPVTLDFDQYTGKEGNLSIHAYDLKLSEYITSTVIIKPNTYHSSYSTVDDGYGSFGSLNILERKIFF